LTAALATVGTNPSAAELASLLESFPYLNAVCNETLRFFPPVLIIRRTCNTPTAILGVPVTDWIKASECLSWVIGIRLLITQGLHISSMI
jgi:cytochrome P450